jgi:hypothetical protein
VKFISLVIAIVVFLAACAPASDAVISPIPGTQTPTNTLIPPTPTSNPLAGAPEGTTGKNKEGEWIKTVTENGNPVNYTWVPELNGWFTSHILESPNKLRGGIPFQDLGDGFPAETHFYFNREESVLHVPFLRHVANIEEWGRSLSGALYNELYNSRYRGSLSRIEFAKAWNAGYLSVSFTTPQGKEYTWNPEAGYKFYAIPWVDADPATHPEFFETPERTQFGDAVYRWTVYTSADGTLVVKAAVGDPASLTEDELLAWFLNPMGTVIEYEQLPQQDKGWKIGDKSSYVKGATTRVTRPYFEIVDNP